MKSLILEMSVVQLAIKDRMDFRKTCFTVKAIVLSMIFDKSKSTLRSLIEKVFGN